MGEGKCQEGRQRAPTLEKKFLESPESGMTGQNEDRGCGTDAVPIRLGTSSSPLWHMTSVALLAWSRAPVLPFQGQELIPHFPVYAMGPLWFCCCLHTLPSLPPALEEG